MNKHLLFVCNQARHRSRTAAELFSNHSTSYAGIYSEDRPLTKQLLEQSDIVFVMEDVQRQFVVNNFSSLALQKRLITLNIPDIYSYNDEKLMVVLKQEVNKYI